MAILMENTDPDFGGDELYGKPGVYDELGESGDDYEELADEDKDVIDRLLDKANTLVKKLKPGKLRDRLENAIDLLTVDEDVETDVEEKEDLLPDSVVNEAVEMLRRID